MLPNQTWPRYFTKIWVIFGKNTNSECWVVSRHSAVACCWTTSGEQRQTTQVPSFHEVCGPDEIVWCGLDLGHSTSVCGDDNKEKNEEAKAVTSIYDGMYGWGVRSGVVAESLCRIEVNKQTRFYLYKTFLKQIHLIVKGKLLLQIGHLQTVLLFTLSAPIINSCLYAGSFAHIILFQIILIINVSYYEHQGK